jgi:hypothetical protein
MHHGHIEQSVQMTLQKPKRVLLKKKTVASCTIFAAWLNMVSACA